MDPDWLAPSQQIPEVEALVAEHRYAHAAAVLQAGLAGRAPTTAEGLRLSDLLVLADRGAQALPILLAVADNLARQGSFERALVVLRRADAIQPGHPKVKERFVSFSRALKAPRSRDTTAPRGLKVERDKTDPYGVPRPEVPRPAPDAGATPPFDPSLFALVRSLGDQEAGEGRHAVAGALFSDLQRSLFCRVAGGLRPWTPAAGDIVVSEGDPGESIFLVAAGSVRVLVLGGHGRPLEIRRIEKGDFFGEVAALSDRPRSATVVAANDCVLLEVARWALERLVETRPTAKAILEEACQTRADSEEEAAVRAIPPGAGPERAAIVLEAQFAGGECSSRVRLQLARLMLDAGQEEDALAVLASVAEELASKGHADQGIAILKKVDHLRRSGTRRFAGRRTGTPAESLASRAHTQAAFREWLLTVLHEPDSLTGLLAPHPAAAKGKTTVPTPHPTGPDEDRSRVATAAGPLAGKNGSKNGGRVPA